MERSNDTKLCLLVRNRETASITENIENEFEQ